MSLREQYKKETGFNSEISHLHKQSVTADGFYIKWLEDKISRFEPQMLSWIKTMFEHAEKKQWFETYWAFDIHGTISKPDYRKSTKEILYYPFAKETLQLLSERLDTVIILFTSSYPEEIKIYNEVFNSDYINFKYINENPDVSDAKGSFGYYYQKMYFNVFLEDKAGFNPEKDWEPIYNYLKETKYRPDPTWSMKYKEEYHKQ